MDTGEGRHEEVVMVNHRPPVSKVETLASLSLFQGLSRRELERVSALCTFSDRPAGSVLCVEGGAGQECFVIAEGEIAVTIDGSHVATLGPGSFCGELAILDGQPRTATLAVTTNARLLVFERREFEDLLESAPRVARRMLATVGARLRHADGRLCACADA
jgi:CRP/FNR family transcriptional regulator